MRVIDDGSLNGYQLGAIETTLLAKTTQTIFHLHRVHTVTFLVTSGTVEFTVANGVIRAAAGDYIAVPIGVPYTFSNPFEASATFHCTFTPSSLVDYFRDMSKLTKGAQPPEKTEWLALMTRYGIETVDMEEAKERSERAPPAVLKSFGETK